jgi:hypothetical protein
MGENSGELGTALGGGGWRRENAAQPAQGRITREGKGKGDQLLRSVFRQVGSVQGRSHAPGNQGHGPRRSDLFGLVPTNILTWPGMQYAPRCPTGRCNRDVEERTHKINRLEPFPDS